MKDVIITDPCYLISDEDWDKLIEEAEQESGENWISCFDNIVVKHLVKISGDSRAVAGSTGFGDWVNEIDGQEFGADSGMVCVVENTKELQGYLEKNKISILPGLSASVSVNKGATYEINRSNPYWSVVKIHSTIESLPPEEPEI